MKNFVQVFILSDIDRKSCTNSGKHFWPAGYSVSGFSKLHSTCPEELFEGTFWFRKLFCFDDVSGHWLEKLWSSVKHFWSGSPNWFLREQRYSLRRKHFGENYNFSSFLDLGRKCFIFSPRRLWTWLTKLHSV